MISRKLAAKKSNYGVTTYISKEMPAKHCSVAFAERKRTLKTGTNSEQAEYIITLCYKSTLYLNTYVQCLSPSFKKNTQN